MILIRADVYVMTVNADPPLKYDHLAVAEDTANLVHLVSGVT